MTARLRILGLAAFALVALAATAGASAQTPAASGKLTFLAASCPGTSSMYTRVAAGQDPTSNEHGTQAAPSDISAYGCSASSGLNFFLLASSTADSLFIDQALTQPFARSSSDSGNTGGTIVASGSAAFVPANTGQARRLSIANYPTTVTSRAAMPVLDLQCGSDGVNSDNADGVGWDAQSFGSNEEKFCIAYVWDGSEPPTATPTNTPAPTNTPVPTSTPTNTPVATSAATNTPTPVTPTATPTTNSAPPTNSGGNVTISVNFPGMSDVHVYAHNADTTPAAATGTQRASQTWRSNNGSLTVPAGAYDIRVVHGPVSVVIDSVNCAANCTVDVPLATLTVNFPGMSDVHSYAHVTDAAPGSYGAQDSSSTWKSGTTTLTLLRGTYDVRVVHGPMQIVLDNVDCTGPSCSATVPTATLTVNFPGMSDVHSYAQKSDGLPNTYGAEDSSSTWKSNTASMTVLRGTYDVRVVHGPMSLVFDNVNCTAETCVVDVPTATLTVNFPGMSDVHSYAHKSDGVANTYGAEDSSSTWKSNSATILLLRGTYDVRVVHGPMNLVFDNVDCSGATCAVDVPKATLTVNFPGMSDVHSYAHKSDGAPNTYGAQDSSSTWKAGSTTMTVLQGLYDVRVVHGPVTLVFDNIDCRAATCVVNAPVAVLTVNFPGLSDAHSYAHASDGSAGTYGLQDSSSTWRANYATMTLLQATYDVRVVHGPITTVLDNVDCRAATCSVDVPLAQLSVTFAGRSDVHTYVNANDGILASATGAQDSSSTWKANSTSFTLLRSLYDVRMRHGANDYIVDAVDCRSATCAAAIEQGVVPGSTKPPTVQKSFVQEDGAFVVWRLAPSAPGAVTVWDSAAVKCEAFGGATCGGIGSGGSGSFQPGDANANQYLLVHQPFDKTGDTCEVSNTAEYSVGAATTKQNVTARYKCSGASTMGWGLFALFAAGACGVAWVVQRKFAWSR